MDPDALAVFNFVLRVFPYAAIIVVVSVMGGILNNWLKIRNGYPLSNSWGMPMHPKTNQETNERVKLLTTENAQLRAELGAIKDRLQNVERIVTDKPTNLARQIDALARDQGGRA